ncbi:MAG: MBL fold metallo-hydrolase [Rikenellaceae bacterium]|nr:MBL fold metallo-hydrolase [Rikenellaceae bacterium]
MKRINILLLLLIVPALIVSAQVPDTFTYKVGDFTVTMMSEGQQEGKSSILIDASEEIMKETIPEGTFPNAVNAFLIENDTYTILADAGFGRKLFDNLEAVGKKPTDIDRIILTHMHGDHIGGLTVNGEIAFLNAMVFIAEREIAYWKEENNKNADQVMNLYDEAITLISPGDFGKPKRVTKGISAIKAYGHTPGHTAYLIESNGEKLLIWGDVTHAMAVQMPYPQISVTYDVDPDYARESRLAILKYVAENNIPVAGMHIAYPGIGYVKDNGKGGYEFVPVE